MYAILTLSWLLLSVTAVSEINHGSTQATPRASTDSQSTRAIKDGLRRFFADPEQFFNDEKERFIDQVEQDDPAKVAEVKSIFSKYEEKLNDLNQRLASTLDKSVDDFIEQSHLRKELSELEQDLARLLAANPDLRRSLERLQQKLTWSEAKKEWALLLSSLDKEPLAQTLREEIGTLDRAYQELNRQKQALRRKPMAVVPQEAVDRLRGYAQQIRASEARLKAELKHIETDLIKRGLIKDAKEAFREAKSIINGEGHTLENQFNRSKERIQRDANQTLRNIFN